jgi:hypothetical protein
MTVASTITLGALAILITWRDWWPPIGTWFGDQSVPTLAVGLPVALATVVALLSFIGIRRVVP